MVLALAPLAAQTKSVQGEQETITATVEAIDSSNRTVTLKGPKGNYVTVAVPGDVKRFESIKVGDKLTATYYTNLVLSVQKPGDKPKDSGEAALTASSSAKPGVTASKQRTITVCASALLVTRSRPTRTPRASKTRRRKTSPGEKTMGLSAWPGKR